MNKVFAIIACVAPLIVLGDTVTNATAEAEKKAKRAQMKEEALKKSGGVIKLKGEGKILFVNCQSRIDEDEVKSRIDTFNYVLKLNCELVKGTWKFGDGRPAGANAAIFIVDDESLPMSLVAVESRWGVVNTATLKLGNRFSKELTRVTALTIGGAVSQFATSCLQPVEKNTDLDNLKTDGFTPDMAYSVFTNMKRFGVTRSEMVSYRKACTMGRAPAPKNEYQKAIWDEVFSIPDKPLTIKKDK